MSIRKKLLLSYIAMIVVPIVVFVLTAILIASLFLNDAFGINPINKFVGDFKNVKDFRETLDKRSEWSSGLTFFAKHEPERLSDSAFLSQTEQELNPLELRLIIERGGQISYISPVLTNLMDEDEAGILEKVETVQTDVYHDNRIKIREVSYSVAKQPFQFDDGSAGVLYILEEDRFTHIFRFFFLTVFLFVVIVIGLTNGFLTFLVSRSFIKPLFALKRAAEHIKEGDLDHELRIARKDEIGQLGAAFEEMRVRLKESIHFQLQVEENRKELLSNISHDLKTPITAITACAEGMRDGIADTPEKQLKYIDMIHSKATHMDRLIDELFLFSKLDLKRLPFHFEQTDMDAYLRSVAEELRLHPQYADISVNYKHPDGGPVIVMADREKLGRVITNIVNNSMKHMDKSEKAIRIGLQESKRKQEVTVKIQDNGRGIESAGLPYIFDRFYRAELSRNTDTGGSGLGLAIVKQIVEEHGGRVWAESAPGEGTAIYFTLKTPQGFKGERHEKDLDH